MRLSPLPFVVIGLLACGASQPPDQPDAAGSEIAYKKCACCHGVEVSWPADQDCGLGACDGPPANCNVAPVDAAAEAAHDASTDAADARSD